MPPQIKIPRLSDVSGFSLVEVTMAIGIISVSLLTMLGLIPVGLNGLKSASDDTVRAQISQQVASKFLLLPYSQVNSYVGQMPFYFDNYGVWQDGPDADTRYTATGAVLATSYPGTEVLGTPSDLPQSVCTLQLTIATLSREKQSYVFHLPNRGE